MSGRPRCFQIDRRDNVATLLDDVEPGPVQVLGDTAIEHLEACERIAEGHKIALRDLAEAEAIIKFGVAIGSASEPITAGGWVHLHNCRSNFDQRSQSLDVHTGSATDTRYE